MINKSYRNKRNNASDLSPKCGFRLGTGNKLRTIEILYGFQEPQQTHYLCHRPKEIA